MERTGAGEELIKTPDLRSELLLRDHGGRLICGEIGPMNQ
jgi:hypothetical protein